MDDAPSRAICNKVVKIVKKHPKGVALDKLAKVFAERFKRELLPPELGFPSMEDFVASLEELVLEDGMIFYKKNIVMTGRDLFVVLCQNHLLLLYNDIKAFDPVLDLIS